jgi:16S rRNA (guanine966-N2)-methyltransferase
VEYARTAFQSLVQNKALLKADQATLEQQDAMQFLQQSHMPFDIIFCDPPYQKGWLTKILPLLPQHLTAEGVVYVEAEYALLPTEHWQIVKQSKAGNVYYHLLKYQLST